MIDRSLIAALVAASCFATPTVFAQSDETFDARSVGAPAAVDANGVVQSSSNTGSNSHTTDTRRADLEASLRAEEAAMNPQPATAADTASPDTQDTDLPEASGSDYGAGSYRAPDDNELNATRRQTPANAPIADAASNNAAGSDSVSTVQESDTDNTAYRPVAGSQQAAADRRERAREAHAGDRQSADDTGVDVSDSTVPERRGMSENLERDARNNSYTPVAGADDTQHDGYGASDYDDNSSAADDTGIDRNKALVPERRGMSANLEQDARSNSYTPIAEPDTETYR